MKIERRIYEEAREDWIAQHHEMVRLGQTIQDNCIHSMARKRPLDAAEALRAYVESVDNRARLEEAGPQLRARLTEVFDTTCRAAGLEIEELPKPADPMPLQRMLRAAQDLFHEQRQLVEQLAALVQQNEADPRAGVLVAFEGICEGLGQALAEDHGAEFVTNLVAEARVAAMAGLVGAPAPGAKVR